MAIFNSYVSLPEGILCSYPTIIAYICLYNVIYHSHELHVPTRMFGRGPILFTICQM